MTQRQLIVISTDEIKKIQKKLPDDIRPLALDIPVHLHPYPSQDLIDEGIESDTLGLFDGTAYGADLREDQPMPPQIFLYIENLWDFAEADLPTFLDELRITYYHELGHYFGWDEDDLAARGLE